MPPYTVDLLPGEPIILQVFAEDYQMAKHMMSSLGEVNQLLDAAHEPMVFIADLRKASLSLDDIIAGANGTARVSGLFKHPTLRKTIIVTGSRIVELAARGMNSAIFGHARVEVSKTLEEAMEMARR